MLNRMVIMFSELNVVSRNFADMLAPAESKTQTYHGRVGAGRRMAGPEKTSTVRLAQETFASRSHQVPKTTVLNFSSGARTA